VIPRVLLVGLGPAAKINTDTMRVATHAAIAQLNKRKLDQAAFLLPKLEKVSKRDILQAVARTVQFLDMMRNHALSLCRLCCQITRLTNI